MSHAETGVPADTTTTARLAVVVLAGGAGRRMGGDKADLPWGEGRLLDHMVELVRPVAAEVLVALRPGQRLRAAAVRHPGVRIVTDVAAGEAAGAPAGEAAGADGEPDGEADGRADSGAGDAVGDHAAAAPRAAPPSAAPPSVALPSGAPPGGPLGGLAAALATTTQSRLVAVAVDLPLLERGLLPLLAAALDGPLPDGAAPPGVAPPGAAEASDPGGPVDIALPVVAGRPQPLLAAYRCATVRPRAEALLALGRRAPMALTDGLRVRLLPEAALRRVDPALASFRNVNTPGDLARARAYRSGGGDAAGDGAAGDGAAGDGAAGDGAAGEASGDGGSGRWW